MERENVLWRSFLQGHQAYYIKASDLSPDFCGDSISSKATVLEHHYVNWGHPSHTMLTPQSLAVSYCC